FERIFADYRRVRNKPRLKIIDIGCSYGIRADELDVITEAAIAKRDARSPFGARATRSRHFGRTYYSPRT
ncbi:hypothetical protein NKI36_30575, partial [Mesorhizobium caraganae]